MPEKTPDLHNAILDAKLGSARKDAQIDACEPFSAALYDVLTEMGFKPEIWTAAWFISGDNKPRWYHAVVRLHDKDYDSKGLFTFERARKDTKVHKSVTTRLVMTKDRHGYDKNDWEDFYKFCFKALKKSLTAEGIPLLLPKSPCNKNQSQKGSTP